LHRKVGGSKSQERYLIRLFIFAESIEKERKNISAYCLFAVLEFMEALKLDIFFLLASSRALPLY